jgi:quinol monooxygenase YgiN
MVLALVVRFEVRDEDAARRFDALTAEVVEQVRAKEPGTFVYAAHRVAGEPLARVFYEEYADRAAFQAHEEAQHVKDFHAAKNPLLVGRRVEYLTPLLE